MTKNGLLGVTGLTILKTYGTERQYFSKESPSGPQGTTSKGTLSDCWRAAFPPQKFYMIS